MACAIYNGTYIAEVAEVAIDPGGQIHVERVWCAVDAGWLVHPDGARNQIEDGIQQAASWTLFEELRIHDGEVTTTPLQDYRIASFRDACGVRMGRLPLTLEAVAVAKEQLGT